MARRDLDFEERLEWLIKGHTKALFVSWVGKVLEYDSGTFKATLRPVNQYTYADEPRAMPPVTNVPVSFAGGGGKGLSVPIEPGDFLVCVVLDISHDEWLSTGNDDNTPAAVRSHALTDSVAIARLTPNSSTLTGGSPDDVVLGDLSGGSSPYQFRQSDTSIKAGAIGRAQFVSDDESVRLESSLPLPRQMAINKTTGGLILGGDGVLDPELITALMTFASAVSGDVGISPPTKAAAAALLTQLTALKA